MATTLTIDGMSCGHCVRAVETALDAVPGVAVEAVTVGEARLHVSDSSQREATVSAAVEAVEAEGFRVLATA